MTIPSAAAPIGLPYIPDLAMSTPACNLYFPLTGFVLYPNLDEIV